MWCLSVFSTEANMTSKPNSQGDSTTARKMTYAVLPERLPAIPPEKMNEAQRKVAAALAAGPRGTVKGPFPAMMRSPEFMDRTQKLGEYIRFGSELDARLRSVASLITIRFWTNQYAWPGHTRQALRAGLQPAIIEAIAEGRHPTGMAEDEEIVYDFMLELYTNKSVSDATYAKAIAGFGEKNVIDLLGVAGYFGMLAMIMNVARTPPPEGKPFELATMPQQVQPDS
jgi:4-carboxymuconolactone decarboxylase